MIPDPEWNSFTGLFVCIQLIGMINFIYSQLR